MKFFSYTIWIHHFCMMMWSKLWCSIRVVWWHAENKKINIRRYISNVYRYKFVCVQVLIEYCTITLNWLQLTQKAMIISLYIYISMLPTCAIPHCIILWLGHSVYGFPCFLFVIHFLFLYTLYSLRFHL